MKDMSDDILDLSGVMELLRVKDEATIRRLRAKHGLPYRRMGGLVRYLRSEVVEWLSEQPSIAPQNAEEEAS